MEKRWMQNLEARLKNVEDALAEHLRMSGNVYTDLDWIKRALWVLTGTGLTVVGSAIVALLVYFLNH